MLQEHDWYQTILHLLSRVSFQPRLQTSKKFFVVCLWIMNEAGNYWDRSLNYTLQRSANTDYFYPFNAETLKMYLVKKCCRCERCHYLHHGSLRNIRNLTTTHCNIGQIYGHLLDLCGQTNCNSKDWKSNGLG